MFKIHYLKNQIFRDNRDQKKKKINSITKVSTSEMQVLLTLYDF